MHESLEPNLKTTNLSVLDSASSEYIKNNQPYLPVYFFRKRAIDNAVKFFQNHFNFSQHKSRILYSVKSNPEQNTLQHLFNCNIKDFDVASLDEIKTIDKLFNKKAKMYFMHPVKSLEAIAEAYFKYNIKDFSLDSIDELHKIALATKNAKDLHLHVRLSIPRSNSAIELSTKFGILPSDSIDLLHKTRNLAKKIGICFHVGSQCMDPIEYRKAIMIAADCIRDTNIDIDVLDIGGGFPSFYPTLQPPKLSSYFSEITDSIKSINLSKNCEIWCEPGRALVAESGSLVVRVELRKDNILYINDGTYGGLFDAGLPNFTYPTQTIRIDDRFGTFCNDNEAFSFFGPTCDSIDFMKGPFFLPQNIRQGDYIEIFQLGAYSKSMRTNFNGFAESLNITLDEKPFFSLFEED